MLTSQPPANPHALARPLPKCSLKKASPVPLKQSQQKPTESAEAVCSIRRSNGSLECFAWAKEKPVSLNELSPSSSKGIAFPSGHFAKELCGDSEAAEAVAITTFNPLTVYDGFILSIDNSFFIHIDDDINLLNRHHIVCCLDFAMEVLGCSAVIVCLNKKRPDLDDALRAFMYTGFSLVNPAVYKFSDKFVMLGTEL